MPERKSHKNEQVAKLYKEFLGEPLGHKSHDLLHTHYTKREKYPVDANKIENNMNPDDLVVWV